VIPNNNPYNTFSTYFAGALPTTLATPGDAGAPTAAGSSANQAAIDRSILDYVLADLNRFSNIVGAADKLAIQAHLQSVRNLENTLSVMAASAAAGDASMPLGSAGACGGPAAAATEAAAGGLSVNASQNIPTLLKLQFDMAAAAFAADLTRVVVSQVGDQIDVNLIMTWLGFTAGGPNPADANTGDLNGFHSIAHRNDADKVTCDTWFQQQLAYMIGQMKSITDPTGASILDSSLFLAMNNMRTGTHEVTGVPVVMAGGLGGYFKTGQSLALAGVSNNRLLLSILAGFGYPVTTFGTASYCAGGPLTQLNA
jgi:hypothetical protein